MLDIIYCLHCYADYACYYALIRARYAIIRVKGAALLAIRHAC